MAGISAGRSALPLAVCGGEPRFSRVSWAATCEFRLAEDFDDET